MVMIFFLFLNWENWIYPAHNKVQCLDLNFRFQPEQNLL